MGIENLENRNLEKNLEKNLENYKDSKIRQLELTKLQLEFQKQKNKNIESENTKNFVDETSFKEIKRKEDENFYKIRILAELGILEAGMHHKKKINYDFKNQKLTISGFEFKASPKRAYKILYALRAGRVLGPQMFVIGANPLDKIVTPFMGPLTAKDGKTIRDFVNSSENIENIENLSNREKNLLLKTLKTKYFKKIVESGALEEIF